MCLWCWSFMKQSVGEGKVLRLDMKWGDPNGLEKGDIDAETKRHTNYI
jgi:hypothetical protein